MNKSFVITVLGLVTASIYLFYTAPPPLQVAKVTEPTISVEKAFEILDQENSVARALYTRDIVGAGKKQRFKFDENWAEDTMHAGPLPAQFLRETSRSLESNPVPLGVFLGSDFAINRANTFEGKQMEMFGNLKSVRQSKFFYAADSERYAYMAPDVAVVAPCVDCHNEHDDSPKKDWNLGDVMGAVTWTYPKKEVGYKEVIEMVAALRKGFRDAYSSFLSEAQLMAAAPEIGDKWPSEGAYVPSADVFMAELERRASANVVSKLIEAGSINSGHVVSQN